MWFDGISIDKGRWSGVEIKMPVITADGIVGRVVSTGPVSAQVMLITDEKSGAGALSVSWASQTPSARSRG
jgi:rod shape-determining protein MreC